MNIINSSQKTFTEQEYELDEVDLIYNYMRKHAIHVKSVSLKPACFMTHWVNL